ncbi:hypothetical protein GGR56DRAFT_257266 [Xylariaceae sp. FL0804]|nr:hypothetical protein GGR56DRAFT_257266 [Xylariaceae sp. FL0804]
MVRELCSQQYLSKRFQRRRTAGWKANIKTPQHGKPKSINNQSVSSSLIASVLSYFSPCLTLSAARAPAMSKLCTKHRHARLLFLSHGVFLSLSASIIHPPTTLYDSPHVLPLFCRKHIPHTELTRAQTLSPATPPPPSPPPLCGNSVVVCSPPKKEKCQTLWMECLWYH